ncbi:hypothetical protein ABTD78_25335, partial [Acinetobacter baumannii]
VKAHDDSIYVGISGGVGVGGKAGIGVAVSFTSITHTVTAFVEQTSLNVGGNVDIEATASTAIGDLGVSYGMTTNQSA